MTNLSDKTDEELMLLYQQDNYQAFEELYSRFSSALYGYLKKSAASYQDADDLFQKTILKLDKYKSKYNAKYSFNSWLYTICKNIKKDFYKSEKTFSLLKDKFEQDVLIEVEMLNSKSGLIQDYRHFDHLTDKEKEIMILKFNEDQSYQEIATKVMVSVSSARQIISRAVKKLRILAKTNASKELS